jgi:hypothetical protein
MLQGERLRLLVHYLLEVVLWSNLIFLEAPDDHSFQEIHQEIVPY